ncbi:helix-turn-helix domain-containing protein [Microseira wollei]|uniref:Transcriptional regulator, AraC family protein n=1 Tax=Microseira wollei NIES-4236 TaxID=2530354 RepID=A0AAV3XM54_9CYAN|nr:helix-turn-helix domain-containing protein [Microseira wollei]GET41542.1 transcriptional regulator, AraC family protein [Microseira wollei NIES-4236]
MVKASQTGSTNLSNRKIPSLIVSSQALGWEPLLVEEFQQPPSGIDIPEGYAAHLIPLCLAPRPHRIHQVVGDRRYTGLYSQGDISITPADIPATYRAEGEDCFLHVQIPIQFLRSVAQETTEIDPDRLELVTEFRVRDPQLEQTLMLLRAELHKGGGWVGRLYVESLANVLAVNLLREYSTTQPRVPIYQGGLSDRQILQVSEYISVNLDRDIKLADLAAIAGVSQFHFSRLFKQSMGISPHQYLLQQRVERAKQMLQFSQVALADIALQCGFNSQSHLGKYFRQFTGVISNPVASE